MAQITANGISIEYDEIGDPKGEPVVLVMGLGAQMIRWPDSFREGLADAGYRVIRYDNRDVGLSQKFEGAEMPPFDEIMASALKGERADVPYDLNDLARDGAAVLETLDASPAHIIGASMGGMIVQIMAARHSDRVRSMTSIMSSTQNPSLPPATPEAMAALTTAPENTERDTVVRHGVKTNAVIGSPGFDYPEDELLALNGASFDRCYYPAGFNRQYAAIIATGDRTEEVKSIKCPSLVIHGADDPLVPVDGGHHTAECIPHAELEIVKGMGHDMPPGVVDILVPRITKFLKAV